MPKLMVAKVKLLTKITTVLEIFFIIDGNKTAFLSVYCRLQHIVTNLFKERKKTRNRQGTNNEQENPTMIVWQEAFDDKTKVSEL